VVLAANPGRVRQVVENPLPRPRDYRSPDLLRLVDQLHDIITGTEMPDVPEPAISPAAASALVEPVPDAKPSEILGLLEYLDARGGSGELFQIVADSEDEFGHVIAVVKAAEMLDFVDTPKRAVLLEPAARRFLAAGAEERKRLWRDQLLKMRLFRELVDVIQRQEDKRVDREFVLEMIAMALPKENYERVFDRMLEWARFGDLFDYDTAAETVSLSS
jgi:NitT/TauT family transport system ATP-binding protein